MYDSIFTMLTIHVGGLCVTCICDVTVYLASIINQGGVLILEVVVIFNNVIIMTSDSQRGVLNTQSVKQFRYIILSMVC